LTSQSDYETAVAEVHIAKQRISVKVKLFSLKGARVCSPLQKVKYKDKQKEFWCFDILPPVGQNNISVKISSPKHSQLKTFLECIRDSISEE